MLTTKEKEPELCSDHAYLQAYWPSPKNRKIKTEWRIY